MTEYEWQEVYRAALLETDWSKMEERIQRAEAGLHERKREFALDHGGTIEEAKSIEDALRGLGVLRREVASWYKQQAQKTGTSDTPRPSLGAGRAPNRLDDIKGR
jgi:uncharacterized protein YecA (UPF0149 family)